MTFRTSATRGEALLLVMFHQWHVNEAWQRVLNEYDLCVLSYHGPNLAQQAPVVFILMNSPAFFSPYFCVVRM